MEEKTSAYIHIVDPYNYNEEVGYDARRGGCCCAISSLQKAVNKNTQSIKKNEELDKEQQDEIDSANDVNTTQQEQIDELSAKTDNNSDIIDDLIDSLSALTEYISGISLDELSGIVITLSGDVEDIKEDLLPIKCAVENLIDRVCVLEYNTSKISGNVESISGDVENLFSRTDCLREAVISAFTELDSITLEQSGDTYTLLVNGDDRGSFKVKDYDYLEDLLSAETENRIGGDSELLTKITDEEDRAISVETYLESLISANTQELNEKIDKLSGETASAVSDLYTYVDDKIAKISGSSSEIESGLNEEIKRAKNAEKELQDDIDILSGDISDLKADVISLSGDVENLKTDKLDVSTFTEYSGSVASKMAEMVSEINSNASSIAEIEKVLNGKLDSEIFEIYSAETTSTISKNSDNIDILSGAIDTKLETSVFNTFSREVMSDLSALSGSVSSNTKNIEALSANVNTKLDKVIFENFSGDVIPRLEIVETATTSNADRITVLETSARTINSNLSTLSGNVNTIKTNLDTDIKPRLLSAETNIQKCLNLESRVTKLETDFGGIITNLTEAINKCNQALTLYNNLNGRVKSLEDEVFGAPITS